MAEDKSSIEFGSLQHERRLQPGETSAWDAALGESRRVHSFENHIADAVTELINAGRAIIDASFKDAPAPHMVKRFEWASEEAARQLSTVGHDIIPNLVKRQT